MDKDRLLRAFSLINIFNVLLGLFAGFWLGPIVIVAIVAYVVVNVYIWREGEDEK